MVISPAAHTEKVLFSSMAGLDASGPIGAQQVTPADGRHRMLGRRDKMRTMRPRRAEERAITCLDDSRMAPYSYYWPLMIIAR